MAGVLRSAVRPRSSQSPDGVTKFKPMCGEGCVLGRSVSAFRSGGDTLSPLCCSASPRSRTLERGGTRAQVPMRVIGRVRPKNLCIPVGFESLSVRLCMSIPEYMGGQEQKE